MYLALEIVNILKVSLIEWGMYQNQLNQGGRVNNTLYAGISLFLLVTKLYDNFDLSA